MKRFELSNATRIAFAEQHRAVQCAISSLANRELGVPARPQGIQKFEGGVTVNDREIAIHRDYVIDDWKKSTQVTAEEDAVVKAIRDVEQIWTTDGAAAIEKFYVADAYLYDPLRDLLGVK